MTLETAIREAASRGLSGLTLWPTNDGLWQASAKRGDGWRVEHAADPADALRAALSAFAAEPPQQSPTEDDIFS